MAGTLYEGDNYSILDCRIKNGKALVSGKDYTVVEAPGIASELVGKVLKDSNIMVPVGSVIQVKVTGLGLYQGSDGREATATGTYRILQKGYDISKATIKINPQSYTGEAIEITDQSQFVQGKVFLKASGSQISLTLGDDLEVVEGSYVKNEEKGTAKVTFRGIGQFGGTRTVSFKINPKDVSKDDWTIGYHNN